MLPHNKTEHSVSRITCEGKKLTYKLSVMQQPKRARACDVGAKSVSVVELRVFKSDPANDAQKTDITFAYNANFILYATLDTSCLVTHEQVAEPLLHPILTGVPVASVAYPDRPSQAGYFIFPDLLIRHEGQCCLKFHLYEEIKDSNDADKDSTLPLPNLTARSATTKPGTPQTFLHFRLELLCILP
ncbi:uncharacterized protein N7479_001718 [Penicillium vulpinum]|uniref:Developmental and secondary metabolism regulator veA n=1 Tax=Penicillium vulpinum TaxID=29845 RepID=A0A1V6R7U3_9EURO|nr:uncharacterized protein N7479_001718 [Penicillium vulpinum]KAJ5971800.1 hypothetical protein N7479_001718 [Penicillium vulpinum]OQD97549.1 hypothetical protein PENVUL_c083G04872 [Penicillium vulpinum]